MSQSSPAIVILGGGFGGLFTALRLSQFPWSDGPWSDGQRPRIHLVNATDHFLFTPLLYELVTGELDSWEIAPPFSELLSNTTITFQQTTVQGIDLGGKQVQLASGKALHYDRLVLALGGETPLDQVPGAKDHALPFRTIADAHHLRDRLHALESVAESEPIRVVVVGAGPSGVELSCKLADRLGERGRIRLVDRNAQILKSSPDFNREAAQKSLAQRGVWVDLDTQVQSIEAAQMTLIYKEQSDVIPYDLVIWVTGNTLSPTVQDLSVAKQIDGRLKTLSTLQLLDHADVYALGDLADSIDGDGNAIPTTAQAALQAADCTAWNIWASLTDRPLLPFRYSNLGEMLTLGNDSAALSSFGITLDGPLAYLARRLIYLYRMPTLEHQLKVGFNWLTKPLLDLLTPNTTR
jgi:demethylphylloquinone reductase